MRYIKIFHIFAPSNKINAILNVTIMKNTLFYGLVILTLNCSGINLHSQETAASTQAQDSVYVGNRTYFSDDFVREDVLYTSIIRVDKQKNQDYALSVEMILKNNAYFVSPNAKRNFTGKFIIVLSEPDKLELCEKVAFDGVQYRKDIGYRAIARENA